MARDADSSTIVALCILLGMLLTGCGTDVMGLLNEESRTYWRAERMIAAAEELDPSLLDSLLEAENEKYRACESISTSARERILEGEFSFSEQFWSNLTQLFVRIFPVTVVESCAEAHERYDKELVALRQHLEKMGVHAENRRAIVPH